MCGAGRRDDTWVIAEYLNLEARYFQFAPRWYVPSTGQHASKLDSNCGRTLDADDCTWHLDESDLDAFQMLLDQVLRDGGRALCARAVGVKSTLPRIVPAKERIEMLRRLRMPAET